MILLVLFCSVCYLGMVKRKDYFDKDICVYQESRHFPGRFQFVKLLLQRIASGKGKINICLVAGDSCSGVKPFLEDSPGFIRKVKV